MNIIKKICILGSPGVGKTSTIARYVKGIYSEAYHSTIGVKIDKKNIRYDNLEVTLILWDLAGEDSFEKYRQAYLRGASGLIFIADGTRPDTLQHALAMQQSSIQNIETPIPHIFLINKKDLHDQWKISESLLNTIAQEHPLLLTSAKTGETIDEAFQTITRLMLTTKYTSYIPPSSPNQGIQTSPTPTQETSQPTDSPINYPDFSNPENSSSTSDADHSLFSNPHESIESISPPSNNSPEAQSQLLSEQAEDYPPNSSPFQ